jgi:hypothetical protein
MFKILDTEENEPRFIDSLRHCVAPKANYLVNDDSAPTKCPNRVSRAVFVLSSSWQGIADRRRTLGVIAECQNPKLRPGALICALKYALTWKPSAIREQQDQGLPHLERNRPPAALRPEEVVHGREAIRFGDAV